MRKETLSLLCSCAMPLVLSACVTLANEGFKLRLSDFETHYGEIKAIVIRDAADNGYSNLTSYVKPSQYNGWKGNMYFAVKTGYGTDQLEVEFSRDGDYEYVYINGGGVEGNPNSAAKEILADIRALR